MDGWTHRINCRRCRRTASTESSPMSRTTRSCRRRTAPPTRVRRSSTSWTRPACDGTGDVMQPQNQSRVGEVFVDVIVVGGGAAGLAAALVLARARRRVLIVDDRTHRNATVDEFHGFPTRDSMSPANFRSDARRELDSYGVTFNSSTLTGGGCRSDDEVAIAFADGVVARARVAVIATGVQDQLPPIDGL